MGVSPRVVDWLTQEVSNKNSNQLFDELKVTAFG